VCRTCDSHSSERASREFRERVEELGGKVIETEWLGALARHRIICAVGHEVAVRPAYVQQGGGICPACGKGSDRTWRAFRERVEELGGIVVEPKWLGGSTLHRIICAVGHEGATQPAHAIRGKGICRTCAGKTWDAFYVVTDTSVVKFGITSGDPRPRLSNHKADGLDKVARLLTDFEKAPQLERACLRQMRKDGFYPVRGREYYRIDALPTILEVVDKRPW
jgi:hypothetical protein